MRRTVGALGVACSLLMAHALMTRRVKTGGVYWIAWRPKGRNREHRRKLWLFAPRAAIDAARSESDDTAARRVAQRDVSARHRDKVEADYRSDFAAAEQAVVVGSGRVGRTKTLPLDERVALASPDPPGPSEAATSPNCPTVAGRSTGARFDIPDGVL